MQPLTFSAVLGIVMRFLHVFSAIALLGGVLALRTEAREESVASWRGLAISAVAGLLISGLYNFLNKTGLTPAYHAIFGVKVLLALHVFAVSIIATKPNNLRRSRQLKGVAASGILIVLLSAVLRWITLRG